MIQYRQALSIIEEVALGYIVGEQSVDIESAMGRLLAEQVRSPEDVPSFANSAMDGFIVFASDTVNASLGSPVALPVNGLIAAGDQVAWSRAGSVQRGVAIEIMTGAPVPTGGHDAVVRIEDVKVIRSPSGEAVSIELKRPAKAGDNIRLSGTDYSIGQVVMNPGVLVNPTHILACASLGITSLKVKKKPRVAVLSTGSELVSSREVKLSAGQIRNSTGPYLEAALRQIGTDSHYMGIMADEPSRYRRALEGAILDGAEIIVSTGAVSMGKYDFVSDVLTEMGAKIHFHKVSIRPGKPLLFAEVEHQGRKCVVFGVPGNPVSTAVALRFFIEPYTRTVLSLPREIPVRAHIAADSMKPEGLRCFYKGSATAGETGIQATVLKGQASYVVSALVDASCWVVLPEEGRTLPAGTVVDVYPLHNSFQRGVFS